MNEFERNEKKKEIVLFKTIKPHLDKHTRERILIQNVRVTQSIRIYVLFPATESVTLAPLLFIID